MNVTPMKISGNNFISRVVKRKRPSEFSPFFVSQLSNLCIFLYFGEIPNYYMEREKKTPFSDL